MFKVFARQKKILVVYFAILIFIFVGVAFVYFQFPDSFAVLKEHNILLYAIIAVTLLTIYIVFKSFTAIEKSARRNVVTIRNTLGAEITETYLFGGLALASYNENGVFIWMSELFERRNIDLIGEKVLDKFPTLKPFFGSSLNKPNEINIFHNQRQYSVMILADIKLLIFKDITEFERLVVQQKEQRPVFLYIVLDNLVDVVRYSVVEEVLILEQNIRRMILDWSKRNNLYIKKEKDDTYFAILQEENYQNIIHEKFKIIDDVFEMSRDKSINLTISLGVGRGVHDFGHLAELASSAIDVALSRGGNQAVVNNYGSNMEFFGGANVIKAKRSRVKTRVIAQSLYAHIQKGHPIFIVPHEQADFDSIGSALALQKFCALANKEAYIVADWNQIESKARLALNEMFSLEYRNSVFLGVNRALEKLEHNKDALVIAVDLHRSIISTAPKLFETALKVAIIDHHRRAEDAIDNPVFSYIEPNASSTCELVIDLIRAINADIKLPSEIATYMLLGIHVDTNSFKGDTSTNTFEAATYLKEIGADNQIVENYLKDQYEEYILKTKILANIETPFYGVIVAVAPEDQMIDRTLLAKASQEAVEVKGIKSAFVIGYIDQNTVAISARSDGSFNVQVIMEKLGGGGHYSSAGCQLKSITLEEARNKLIEVMELYELYETES